MFFFSFAAWVNSHLRKVGTNIVEIDQDFSDGIRLAQLLQVIAGDKVEKLNSKPTMRIHKIQNTGQCLKFIADKGVKLVGIAPEGKLFKASKHHHNYFKNQFDKIQKIPYGNI